MLEPSGAYYGYTACTAGKGRQTAKAEFEKTDFSKLTCREALFYICKMYYHIWFRLIQTHDETIEKKHEYEISWVCEESKNAHQMVPLALINEAAEKATAKIEEEQMGWLFML